MIIPGNEDLVIIQGASFNPYWIMDIDGTPVNLTTYTAAFMARHSTDNETALINLTTENGGITLNNVGKIQLISLAYGHTAVSLATAEAAAAKAPRRIPLGIASWAIGAAIGSQPQCGRIQVDLGDAPVFVNPGEFVQLVGKFLAGTATASQVINFVWQPIYGWE